MPLESAQLLKTQQRGKLLECLFAVAAADGSITSPESGEIVAIAEELGFTRAEANALRSTYREKLSELVQLLDRLEREEKRELRGDEGGEARLPALPAGKSGVGRSAAWGLLSS